MTVIFMPILNYVWTGKIVGNIYKIKKNVECRLSLYCTKIVVVLKFIGTFNIDNFVTGQLKN